MHLPLREVNIDGLLVDPAALMLLAVCLVFFGVRYVLIWFVDLNRLVWRRPLVGIAILVILYSLSILALRPL